MNNPPQSGLTTGYKENYTKEMLNPKLHGLQTGKPPNRKNHIDNTIPKLRRACYTVKFMFHISKINTLKSVHFTYFHSAIKYR